MAKAKITKGEKLVLTRIGETPFQHATNGEKNYIISGKVLLETDKNKEECETWLEKKPWEAISLLSQAITNEMLKKQN